MAADSELTPSDHGPSHHALSDDAVLAELGASLRSAEVTLYHLVIARHFSQHSRPLSANRDDERILYAELVPQLLAAYQRAQGKTIVDQQLCRNILAGALLVQSASTGPQSQDAPGAGDRSGTREADDFDIEFCYLPEGLVHPGLEAAIWNCKELSLQAAQCRTKRRAFLMKSIYSVLALLLTYADSPSRERGQPEQSQRVLQLAQQELAALRRSVAEAVAQENRQIYIFGMMVGAVVVFTVAYSILVFFPSLLTIEPRLLVEVSAAGAIGAAVSVMGRLTSNRLQIDPAAGTLLTALAGAFRLLIGSVFGLAIFIFIESQILPITINVTGQQREYFYTGLAFLAGFSERLAQDAVARAGGVIMGPAGDEKRGADLTARGR
jgi:hypothetical protein